MAALPYFDPTDGYGATADIGLLWASHNALLLTLQAAAGRRGGKALRLAPGGGGESGEAGRRSFTARADAYWALALKLDSWDGDKTVDLPAFLSGETVQVGATVNADRTISFWRGSSANVLGTTAALPNDGAYHTVEAAVLAHATAGTLRCRIDAAGALSLTGQNTDAAGSGTMSAVRLSVPAGGDSWLFHDLVVDGGTTLPTDGATDFRVDWLSPAADTATKGFAPGPGQGGGTLLAHFDGANGSTVMADDSPYGHTMTAVGDAHLDTAQKKFGTASLRLDGTGDGVRVAYNSVFRFPGDFTIALWCKLDATQPTTDPALIALWDSAANKRSWMLQYDHGTSFFNLRFWRSVDGVNGTNVAGSLLFRSLIEGNFAHVAVTRAGDVHRVFFNGDMIGEQTMSGALFVPTGVDLTIGARQDGASGLALCAAGWIDEVAITDGTALYTSSFTPPTTPPTLSGDNFAEVDDTIGSDADATYNAVSSAGATDLFVPASLPDPGYGRVKGVMAVMRGRSDAASGDKLRSVIERPQ